MKKIRSIIMLALALGMLTGLCATAEAASLKTTAKKKITSTVKKQYSKIKTYASKWNYTIVRDKKEGKLAKTGDNAYAKKWNIRLKNKKSKAFLVVVFDNVYSGETKKVTTKITLDVYAEKYKGNKVGKDDSFDTLSAFAQVMKQMRTTKGLAAYGIQVSGDSDAQAQALGYKYHFGRTKQCTSCFKTYIGAWAHQLFCSLCSGKSIISTNTQSYARSWNKNFSW